MIQFKLTKQTIILITLLTYIFSMIVYKNKQKRVENFSIKDIEKVGDDIKDVTKLVKDIPNEIKNIDKKLTQQVNNAGNEIVKKTEQMGKEIEKKTITILTDKLTSIFTQIGDIFNKALVEPLLTLFVGIGNIFQQIFNILQEIGNKIVSLPNCIMTYAIKETFNTFDYIYNKITPKFLKNIISFIYRYTLRYLFDFIGYITGYDESVRKCYGFNVSSEVEKINSNLNKINTSFKNNFGRLDFSKIKV